MEPPLDLENILGDGGVLSRRLPGFRVRPSQLAMARAIGDAIADGHHAVIEAGTGTGKSLAYLVPALLHWVALGKKVVISTHTIALQEQLFTRDLPLLAACLPIEFIAEKTLGRGNYLGIRRMEHALLRANTLLPGDPESEALKAIFRWSEKTPSGVRQDVAPSPSPATWDLVKSETDNCLGKRCRTYESCFFQTARRRWHQADILITNHALYLTDLRLRQMDSAILPDHDLLIIDEAHRFEAVASEHFGLEVSRRGAQYLLRRIVGTSRFPGILRQGSTSAHEEARRVAQECAACTSMFFDAVDDWLMARESTMVRIREPGIWQDLLSGPFLQLAGLLLSMSEATSDPAESAELLAFSNRCREIASSCRRLLAMGEVDSVTYAERNELRSETQVVARPLNVAAILRENLFTRMRSVIMTSATLSTDGTREGLNFFRERMGCEVGESLRLSTPFDLKEQVQVRVAADLPEPDHAEFAPRACARALEEILAAGGGAFLLFTSYRMLDDFYRRLYPDLERAGLKCYRQSEDVDRTTILERFREDGNGVLFGAESFWEGVDVPGDALRLVIVVKLPFPVPTLPIHEAMAEMARAEGKNPFTVLSLPIALLKFRQGFGRLIRSETDRGVFVCLDSRLHSRNYGTKFLRSLR